MAAGIPPCLPLWIKDGERGIECGAAGRNEIGDRNGKLPIESSYMQFASRGGESIGGNVPDPSGTKDAMNSSVEQWQLIAKETCCYARLEEDIANGLHHTRRMALISTPRSLLLFPDFLVDVAPEDTVCGGKIHRDSDQSVSGSKLKSPHLQMK